MKTQKDLAEAFLELNKQETKKKFDNIFIDSLTEIGESCLMELKEDPKFKDPKMALKMYGDYNDDFSNMAKAFRDLRPYSVFFTCLNAYEKNGMQMVEGFSFPGTKVKEKVKSWFDLVMKYEVYRDGDKVYRKLITDTTINDLAKDRSGKLEQYEDADLSAIKNKILGSK